MNKLYFGDCLNVLEHIQEESVDLIYLDPPFNSKRDYNLLFKSPKGHESEAQITAFEDSWHWGRQAEREFDELLHQSNTAAAEMMAALRTFLGENDMMAYLTMMAYRLLALHRVLKPTGSLYLHCDPTASHYLKIVMDGVFGKENYRNEIIWKRTTAHSDSRHWGNVHDVIFFYTKTDDFAWNAVFLDPDEAYKERFKNVDAEGRKWTDDNLTAKGLSGGGYEYEYKGVKSLWRAPLTTMKRLDAEGRLHFTRAGGIRLKRYLDESPGSMVQDVVTDIFPINSQAAERLGYPTQKPVALLERILRASSSEGDVVLDPFCGCGTAVHAAQKLGRRWIGIDITHLSIALIEKRLRDAFPGIQFEVEGTPKDFEGARDLAERDKYQFQWWACALAGAQPYQGRKKGADGGIDGLIFFKDDEGIAKKIVVSVKGGESVGLTMLKELIATVEGSQAQIGLFVTLARPSKPMEVEAVKAGFYASPLGHRFPRIQILTIEDLLSGKVSPQYPAKFGDVTFKKAAIEKREEQLGLF